jgi:hypothetical protein
MKQFSVLRGPVMKTILKYMKDIETIKFIGHSLGGALATLFTGSVASLYSEINVICHTFGSPRVGNKNYALWFKKNVSSSNCVRFMIREDPVAQMPISPYFYHVSDAKCIMKDMTVKDLPDNKWYLRLINFRINCCKPVLAHSCDRYIELLTKLYNNCKIIEEDDIQTIVIV